MSIDTDRDQPAELNYEAEIEERAKIQLQHSPYRALRRIDCQFAEGVLRLSGNVPTFHYKQLAQVALADLNGIERVVNDITVG